MVNSGTIRAYRIAEQVVYADESRLVVIANKRCTATCPRCGFRWQVRRDRVAERKSVLCSSCRAVNDPLWSTP